MRGDFWGKAPSELRASLLNLAIGNPCSEIDVACAIEKFPPPGVTPVSTPARKAPHEWICNLYKVLHDPVSRSLKTESLGTGFAVDQKRIVTAAHNLLNQKTFGGGTRISRTVTLVAVFGRSGPVLHTDNPTSFGAYRVPGPVDLASQLSGFFWVAPEWEKMLERGVDVTRNTDARAFDYGVIKLETAIPCASVKKRSDAIGFWPEFWPAASEGFAVSETTRFWRKQLEFRGDVEMAGYPAVNGCRQFGMRSRLEKHVMVGKERFKGLQRHGWCEFKGHITGGWSGSPIWQTVGSPKNATHVCMGIVVQANDPPSDEIQNSETTWEAWGTLLTPFVWDRIRSV